MGAKKPRIVIIGAGMAGLTAANKLYSNTSSRDLFELCVVEGGARIGGRINSSQFCGDKIEMGATWIHGIGGSPIYQIAHDIGALESQQPWECMDGFLDVSKTVAEGGFEVNPSIVEPISVLFNLLMDFAQGKTLEHVSISHEHKELYKIPSEALKICTSNSGNLIRPSVGGFLRKGLDIYWELFSDQKELKGYGNWSRKLLEEAIFALHENIQRTYTSAGDLSKLDFDAESEYRMFPGEEITIAKGYSSVIEYLASVLPPELIQFGKKVTKIEWQHEGHQLGDKQNGYCDTRPVKLHFSDGSTFLADHVIVTVSLGVLKASIRDDSGLFSPPLPSFKTEAISRLGFGVVNKLFLQLDPKSQKPNKFPFLQMAFHRLESELRSRNVPWWMRRTASLCPIYHNSSVLLSWFAGKEALELESLNEEEIIDGVSSTISCLLLQQQHEETKSTSHELCNGNTNSIKNSSEFKEVKFKSMLKSHWGKDPLFLGSYSYVGVGSSGNDFDAMAEPLPRKGCEIDASSQSPPLQILFAGEATHRTHYSTTHGAYFSGLREANRLLQHYQCI